MLTYKRDQLIDVKFSGAGKTSLFGALLRLTELDEGKVFIDGIDVSQIGLEELRSSVAVIPQDPVLFQVQ